MTLPLFIFASLNFSTDRWQAVATTIKRSGRGQGDSPYKKSIGLKNLVFVVDLAEDADTARGGSWLRIPPRAVNVLLLREEACTRRRRKFHFDAGVPPDSLALANFARRVFRLLP